MVLQQIIFQGAQLLCVCSKIVPIDIDGITYVSSTRENYYTRLIFENYFEHVGMNYVVVRTQHSWIADKLDIGRAPAV